MDHAATANPQPPQAKTVFWICVLLAAVVAAAYCPVVGFQFIHLDDPEYVWQNPHVQSGLNQQNFLWALTAYHSGNWHPLTWISHMLDAQVYGMNAGGHHATNVLFHVANTVLLFLVLRRLTGGTSPASLRHELRSSRRQEAHSSSGERNQSLLTSAATTKGFNTQAATWSSAFVAALFGLHPLHVESVAWVAERKDVLSTFFFLLTLYAYARCAQGRMQNAECRMQNWRWYLLALTLFALGLMSKPMLVTLPFLLLLLDWWPLHRFELKTHPSSVAVLRRVDSTAEGGKLKTVLPLVLEKIPFLALSAGSCVVTFLAQRSGDAVIGIGAIPIGVRFENACVAYLRYVKKLFWPDSLAIVYPHSPIEPDTLTVAVLVLLVISALAFVYRRQHPYLAVGWLWFLGSLVPVIGLVQVGVQSMADRYTYVPFIGLFIALTWGVDEILRDWRHRRLVLTGGALAVLAACLTLTVTQLRFWKNSETLFRHALAVTTDNPLCQMNLGNALTEQGKLEEAAQHFAETVRLWPNYIQAMNNLGFVLLAQVDSATGTSNSNNQAFALAVQGKLDEAISLYRQALNMRPNEAKTHFLLGSALSRKGELGEAIAEYKTAVQLDPNHLWALNNLAWLLATVPDPQLRDGAEAVRLAQQACGLTEFRETQFVGTLAAAYAEAGRFEEAIQTAGKAIALATAQSNDALAAKNRELLELYRAGKPYHDAARN